MSRTRDKTEAQNHGTRTLLPWTEYLLGLILAAYRRLGERVGSLTTARGAKSQMVLDTIAAFSGDFSTAEIQEHCPSVSLDLIRRILQEQKKLGAVEPLGRGPQARWRKSVSRVE